MKNRCVCSMLAVVVALLAQWSGRSLAEELRVWKDSSGKFSLEAELLEQDEDNVRLKKTNGKTIRIPKAKLCQEDRDYLEALAANPFALAEEEAGESSEEKEVSTAAVTNGVTIPELNATVSLGDWSANKMLIIGGNKAWQYEPAGTDPPAVTLTPDVIPIASESSLAEVLTFIEEKLVISQGSEPTAVFSFRVGDLLSGKDFLEVCDLTKGTTKLCPLDFQMTFCDLSPDGKEALVIQEYKPLSGGFNEKNVLAIVDLQNEKAVLTDRFAPYRKSGNEANAPFQSAHQWEVDRAVWADDQHIFTGQKRKMTLWARNGWKALFTLDAQIATLALTPDRRYFAAASGSKVGLWRLEDGAVCGTLDAEGEVRTMQFAPGGDRLAVVTTDSLLVFSLKDGRNLARLSIAANFGNLTPHWTGEQSVLVGSILYDIERCVPLCDYETLRFGCDAAATGYGKVWLVLKQGFGHDRVMGLLHVTLPHPEAANILVDSDLTKSFALCPDAKIAVKLDLNNLFDESEAREILLTRLQERGFVFDEQSPIQLTLRFSDTGKEEEISYGTENSPFPAPPLLGRHNELGRIKLKVFLQEATITESGKELWTCKELTTGPRRVEYDPDKKIEDIFRETNKPTIEFIKYLPLPRYLSRTGEGASALTEAKIDFNGVQSP
ncbi:MAG: SHD1 domain-containing protein [Planctomycetia bacterium]|nr:SHD1 domain-containing protein [Planctomycetia bacterium]